MAELNIISLLLTPNKYSRPGTQLKQVKGIVVHYVGNPGSTAQANRNYFENLKAGKKDSKGNFIYASSQYIIGLDGEMIQCVPENEVAYCSNNRNNDTISIECCHPLPDGKFTEATYKSLIQLLADICKRHGLNPLKDIIRHYDVTGKSCPLYHVNNRAAWDSLKNDVQTAMCGEQLHAKEYVKLSLDGNVTEVRADNVDGTYVSKVSELARILGDIKIPIRYVLEKAGKEVSWDENTNSILACDDYLHVLYRITEAEAGGEDDKGKILVVNVIMNRVKHKDFPNTIRDVVFQENQFEPTRNGEYEKVVVSESTVKAVHAALLDTDYSQGSLYFRSTKGATPDCWHEQKLTRLFVHGGHVFYI